MKRLSSLRPTKPRSRSQRRNQVKSPGFSKRPAIRRRLMRLSATLRAKPPTERRSFRKSKSLKQPMVQDNKSENQKKSTKRRNRKRLIPARETTGRKRISARKPRQR